MWRAESRLGSSLTKSPAAKGVKDHCPAGDPKRPHAQDVPASWSLALCPGVHVHLQGYSWAEDKEHCEEYGRMLQADPSKVSSRAKKRGLPQVSLHPCQLLASSLLVFTSTAWFRLPGRHCATAELLSSDLL